MHSNFLAGGDGVSHLKTEASTVHAAATRRICRGHGGAHPYLASQLSQVDKKDAHLFQIGINSQGRGGEGAEQGRRAP